MRVNLLGLTTILYFYKIIVLITCPVDYSYAIVWISVINYIWNNELMSRIKRLHVTIRHNNHILSWIITIIIIKKKTPQLYVPKYQPRFSIAFFINFCQNCPCNVHILGNKMILL